MEITISIIIDILVGFIIGLIINSNWFQNSFNTLFNKIFQRNARRIKKASEETLESFYRELYKKSKMQIYTALNYIIFYSMAIFLILGTAVMILNIFIQPTKLGNIIIPNWVFVLIGDVLAIIYKYFSTKRKVKATYLDFLQ